MMEVVTEHEHFSNFKHILAANEAQSHCFINSLINKLECLNCRSQEGKMIMNGV